MEKYLQQLHQNLLKTGQILISVKAIPSAQQTGWFDILTQEESIILKLKIAAPPEKNKANKELIKFLSAYFQTPKDNIKIIIGHTSPHKLIQVKKSPGIK